MNIRVQYTLFHLILTFSLLGTSCGIATKQDLAILKGDLESTIKEEAQNRNAAAASIIYRAQPLRQVLADKIAGVPLWTWFSGEFILFGGFFLFNAVRLNRRPYYRRDPLTDEEYDSLSLGNKMLGYFLARRRIEPVKPELPDPPDNKPPLRVVK